MRILLPALFALSLSTLAHGQTNELLDGNNYRIISKFSGKVLDVTDWSQSSGQELQQWTSGGNQANQLFTLRVLDGNVITLNSVYSHFSVIPSGNQNGASVIQQNIVTGVQPQIWVTRLPDHSYELRFSVSGKCMDVRDWANYDGGRIQQWDCHGGDNQAWILNRVTN